MELSCYQFSFQYRYRHRHRYSHDRLIFKMGILIPRNNISVLRRGTVHNWGCFFSACASPAQCLTCTSESTCSKCVLGYAPGLNSASCQREWLAYKVEDYILLYDKRTTYMTYFGKLCDIWTEITVREASIVTYSETNWSQHKVGTG